MKTMRILSAITVCLTLIFFLSSCSNTTNKIEGWWNCEKFETYVNNTLENSIIYNNTTNNYIFVFFSDGTGFHIEDNGKLTKIKFEIENNTLIISYYDDNEPDEIDFTDSLLINTLNDEQLITEKNFIFSNQNYKYIHYFKRSDI